MTLVITETGLAAIGIEPEGSSAQSAAATKTPPARRQPSAAKAKGKAAAAGRSGTKQAVLIDLLARKAGAGAGAGRPDATCSEPIGQAGRGLRARPGLHGGAGTKLQAGHTADP